MAMNIPSPVQILRATQAEIAERTGANGELNWAEDTHELYIHDGVTKGGHLIAGGGGGSYTAGAGVKISDDGVISVRLDDAFATVNSDISNGIIGRSSIFAGNLDTLDSGYSNTRLYYHVDSFATGSKPFGHISFFLADLGMSQVAIAESKIAVRSRSSTRDPWPEWVMVGGTSVTAGDGITVTDGEVSVDDTVIRTTGNQTKDGTLLVTGGLFGKSVALSGSSIDISQGSCFTKTITAATTFVFTGVPSNATANFSLVLTNGSSQTVTWPSSVKWSGGTAPTLAASGIDVITFLTADGGVTWYGVHSVQGAA